MSIQFIRDQLPQYAKDIKLNLGKYVSSDGVDGLSINQSYGIALASACATKNADVITAVYRQVADTLSHEEVNAAKSAATIMAMNNVYYRFVHLSSDKEYARMSTGLRMNVIGNPGVAKVDFELYSLAVSSINGCGMCIDAHVHEVVKSGISKQGIQSSIRIASVLAAAAQALTIESSQFLADTVQIT